MVSSCRGAVAKTVAGSALLLALPLALPAQSAPKPSKTSPATTQPAPAPPAADSNAFPEAESEAAQKKAEADAGNDGVAPASSGAPAAAPEDTEPSSSSRSRFKGVDLLGDNDSRTSDGAGHTIVDPKLGAKDLKVGQLYMAEGDYQGAYARFKEATQVAPGNTDAVFYLAEAARKTSHLDEAASNYKLYLNVKPNGKRAKDALKALKELAGK